MNDHRRFRKTLGLLFLIIIVFMSSGVAASEIPLPTPAFYVNDYANVIDSQTEEEIIQIGTALENKTKAQVVVVTVEGIGDVPLEEYTIDLFRKWEIGDSEEDNGVLLFLDAEGRWSRIEVGYGLEGTLTDGKTGRIQDDYMLPYYSEGNYSEGILQGFYVVVNEIYKEYGYEENYIGDGIVVEDQNQNEGPSPLAVIVALIFIVPLIILDFKFTGGVITYTVLRSIGRGGSRGGGRGGGRSGGGGSAGGGGSSRGF